MRTRSTKNLLTNSQIFTLKNNMKKHFLGRKRNKDKDKVIINKNDKILNYSIVNEKILKSNLPSKSKIRSKRENKLLSSKNINKNNLSFLAKNINLPITPIKQYSNDSNFFINNHTLNKNSHIKIMNEVFNDTFVDSLMHWRHEMPPGGGLLNLGNTCFLNSVLQCILYTAPLKNYFNFSDHVQTCKIKGVCFICEYGRLAKMVEDKKTAIIPKNIIENIKNISHHLKIGRQEDAHEFLLYFLAAMENSATNYVLTNEKKFNKIKNNKIPFYSEDNLIQKIFGGSLVSSVTCKKCKTVSCRSDKFIDISLEVANCNNLLECFDHFCKPEDLTGMNKYFCEKCKLRNDSIKKLSFHQCKNIYFIINFLVPRIIIIHLKRFDNYQRKIKKFIKFDKEINLSKYRMNNNREKVSYQLSSVLVHKGSSIYSGHYYCYARVANHNWYKFNDHSVVKVEESQVLKETPYLLFYEKVIDKNRIKVIANNNYINNINIKNIQKPIKNIKIIKKVNSKNIKTSKNCSNASNALKENLIRKSKRLLNKRK